MNLAHRSTRSARPIILSTSFTLLAMAAAATRTACGGGDDERGKGVRSLI